MEEAMNELKIFVNKCFENVQNVEKEKNGLA